MKDKWINIGYEGDELKPYREPEEDFADAKRIGSPPLCLGGRAAPDPPPPMRLILLPETSHLHTRPRLKALPPTPNCSPEHRAEWQWGSWAASPVPDSSGVFQPLPALGGLTCCLCSSLCRGHGGHGLQPGGDQGGLGQPEVQ